MRVFICFEGSCEPFDIPPDQTAGAMKQMLKDNFLVQLTNEKQYLELSYGGAALQDSWALCDVGITSGSAIRCLIKSEQKPVMYVFNAVTGETFPIRGSEALLHMSVARLKTVVSMQSGLPVSTFRLSTPAGVQLYDCNHLQDYAIKVGTTLRLDTWDGWVEFLQGCLLGHRLTVQSHLSENKPEIRFQLQVALYIAASLGHLDLADWLLERGIHAEEPVGVHPYRQWCHQTAHRDTGKCPIHIAAESSQLLILKLFITKNFLTLACLDPAGRDPLKVAIQRGHRDCVRYLANKLCSVVSLPSVSLPMRVYLQIKRWVHLGQKRAASNRCQYTNAALKVRVEDMLLVDGFNPPNMSSKSRKAVIRPRRGIKAKALQPLPPISNLLSVQQIPSKRAPQRQLSSLQSVNPGGYKEMQKKRKQDVQSNCLLDELRKEDSSLCKGKCILPPITNRERVPRLVFVGGSPKPSHILTASLESFSPHSGRTPRENAIYCMTIASTFTEKPWLKQLSIARTLIRKHVHMIA
ncbi:protein ANKUB1-like isoform X1 [Dicentrarchus labrax]|uniref:Ankyrin repeat and ubiquitin domain containing 1 n=1 Tax=Dicentrarchus labrax TaxID=13489 RepID=A0A8C4DX74_DICLA|nr:protein ANKUB1-like isoform X1 [Dicentrarchus labrax]